MVRSSAFLHCAWESDTNTPGLRFPKVHSSAWYTYAQGLDTDAPELLMSSGTVLRGEWEESLGSCMFFSRPPPDFNAAGTALPSVRGLPCSPALLCSPALCECVRGRCASL